MFLSYDQGGKHGVWRYLVVSGLTLAAVVLAQLAVLPVAFWMGQRNGLERDAVMAALTAGDLGAIGLSSSLALGLGLLAFVAALAVLLLGVRWIHGRPPLSILTTRPRLDLARIALAALLWFILAGGGVLLAIPKDQLVWQLDWAAFAPLFVVAVLLIPFQVLAEDALFRGYWMQGFARITRAPLMALVISSLIFMAMHMSNPEMQNGLLRVLPFYFGLGFFFGALAILDDGLELGTGCHLGNNLFVTLCLSSTDGAIETASVFQTNTAAIVGSLWVLCLVIPVVTLLLHLKYGFDWGKLRRL